MDRAKMVAELERDEGTRLRPYRDSRGKLTIGIGHNLDDCGISRGAAYYLVNEDLDGVEADLDHSLPWWRRLSETGQRVFANMVFNMGIAKFTGFKKMLACVQAGDMGEAAAEMVDSTWAGQVGPRALRLAEDMRHSVLREVSS